MPASLFADVITDQRVAESLSGEYLLLAADRNRLPNHPALYYAGDFAGGGFGLTGSTRKIPILGLDGFDLPDPVAEGSSISPITVTDQQFTITVARQGKAYQPSDEVRFTDPLGVYNLAAFARDAMMSHDLRLTEMVAGVVGGFALTQTTTGVNLTVATFLAGVSDLEVGSQGTISPGSAISLLHTRQSADLRESFALATAGAIQWLQSDESLAVKGSGYQGRVFGVDVYASGHVPTANAGADRAGGMFVRGGVAWADMSPSADGADQRVIGGKILFERDRSGLAGITAYISASWKGVVRGYDTAPHQLGVSVITDA
jgi:hypothetical protein